MLAYTVEVADRPEASTAAVEGKGVEENALQEGKDDSVAVSFPH